MLVQATARRLHALREPVALIKLDITKAFDTLDWEFLLEILPKMGFDGMCRAWICVLMSSSSTRVLVNGVSGGKIVSGKGLRQGDALLPMLFILAMEALHHLFRFAIGGGFLPPWPGGG